MKAVLARSTSSSSSLSATGGSLELGWKGRRGTKWVGAQYSSEWSSRWDVHMMCTWGPTCFSGRRILFVRCWSSAGPLSGNMLCSGRLSVFAVANKCHMEHSVPSAVTLMTSSQASPEMTGEHCMVHLHIFAKMRAGWCHHQLTLWKGKWGRCTWWSWLPFQWLFWLAFPHGGFLSPKSGHWLFGGSSSHLQWCWLAGDHPGHLGEEGAWTQHQLKALEL